MLDESQMLARLSGDEFAILVSGLSNPMVAGRIAENILDALQAEGEGSDAGRSGFGKHWNCHMSRRCHRSPFAAVPRRYGALSCQE